MQELRHMTFQAQSVFRTDIITNINYPLSQCLVVWDSVVSIVTRYELDGRGIKSPVGARLSAPVQIGHGAHTASHTTGYSKGYSGQGAAMTIHPLLAPQLNKE
jgi:hypothetical protein